MGGMDEGPEVGGGEEDEKRKVMACLTG